MSRHILHLEGSRSRKGLSLLEVLVACGILVIGLSGVAALLPAAGSRLAQASLEDRVGVAAANAYAEVLNRGLLSWEILTGTGSATISVPVVFGKVLPNTGSTLLATGSTAALIDPTRGFVLEDELVYTLPTTDDTPNTSFVSGTTGPRAYKDAVCWGAMLAPTTYPAAAGAPATLSIAVFKKEGTSQQLTLTGSAGSTMFQYTTGASNGASDEATRKKFLAGCTFALAATSQPQWLRVTSSWTNPGPVDETTGIEDATKRKSYVVLDRNPMSTGTTLPVIGFENIMRIDQYQITLD